MPPSNLGKTVILAGLIMTCIGVVMWAAGKVPLLGRLPGDIHVERPGLSLHIPVVTCLLVSIVSTVIINLFLRR